MQTERPNQSPEPAAVCAGRSAFAVRWTQAEALARLCAVFHQCMQRTNAQQELSQLKAAEKLVSSASSERDALSDWGVGGFLFGLLLLFVGAMEKPGPEKFDGGTSSIVVGIGVTLCAISGIALVFAFVAIVKHKHAPQTRKRLDDGAEATRLSA
jgi:hypothetical protein